MHSDHLSFGRRRISAEEQERLRLRVIETDVLILRKQLADGLVINGSTIVESSRLERILNELGGRLGV